MSKRKVFQDDETKLKATVKPISGAEFEVVQPTAGDLQVAVAITKTLKTAKIDHSASGYNTIVSAVTGKRIKVYSVVLVVSGAVNCTWMSAANPLSGNMNFGSKGEGYAQAVQPPAFLFATNAGEALILSLNIICPVDGYVSYWDDDAT